MLEDMGIEMVVIRVVTHCATVDAFVASFAKLSTDTSIFVPTQKMKSVGVETGFSIRLADGTLEATDVPLPGYHSLTEDTLRRLKTGLPPAADVEDCARAAELIDKIYQAAGQGRTA